MCQTLFRIPHELFGVPVFGPGWVLACWLLGALIGFGVRWLRGADLRQALDGLPFTLAGAAVILWVLPQLELVEGTGDEMRRTGLAIRGYGVFMFAAVAAGVALAQWRGRARGLPADRVHALAIWLFVAGFSGARLFFVVQYFDQFRSSSWWQFIVGVLNITVGGLVVYGALLGALIAYLLFVWRYRLPPLVVGDLLAPSMLLGLALGRLGCLMNGCCFGGPADVPWAVRFPQQSPPYHDQLARGLAQGLQIAGTPAGDIVVAQLPAGSPAARAGLKIGDRLLRIGDVSLRPDPSDTRPQQAAMARAAQAWLLWPPGETSSVTTADGRRIAWTASELPRGTLPVHPTQIYSALNAVVLCLFVLALGPFAGRDGVLLAATLTLYPLTRFMLEMIRTDEAAIHAGGLTISQTVSGLVLLIALGLWFAVLRRPSGLLRAV